MKTQVFLSITLFLALSCSQSKAQAFDLVGKRPLEVLEFLQIVKSQVRISKPIKNWVTIDDVVELLPLLDSDVPCFGVAQNESEWATSEKSTVGHEAAYMILGFEKAIYPPKLDSIIQNKNCVIEAKLFIKKVFLIYSNFEKSETEEASDALEPNSK